MSKIPALCQASVLPIDQCHVFYKAPASTRSVRLVSGGGKQVEEEVISVGGQVVDNDLKRFKAYR